MKLPRWDTIGSDEDVANQRAPVPQRRPLLKGEPTVAQSSDSQKAPAIQIFT